MKKNNISRKFDETAFFGSILGSLFTQNQSKNHLKHDRAIELVPINLRRTLLFG